jgi:TRAP-type C4-dicarboxylate transport system permease small subunit
VSESKDDDDDRAGPAEVEGAVPAEPTRASQDLEEAKAAALADPKMKPGVVHEPPDDAVPKRDSRIPETRPHEAPARASATSIEALSAPLTYPDDGPASAALRKLDHYLGIAEQAVMFTILVTVVLVAATHAIKEKVTHLGLWWSADVIRGGTFSLAMIGAAYATQQQRHLAMDLISRKLSPRARLALAAVIEVFTIAVCIMLVRSGIHQIAAYGQETGQHLIDARTLVKFLPLGGVLIALHAAIHLFIHIDYLARGKTPPERMRSAH